MHVRKILIFFFVSVLIVSTIVAGVSLYKKQKDTLSIPLSKEANIQSPVTDEASQRVITPPPIISIEVPFTSQAPFAQWKDPRQQDGCEEASVLMAMHWALGKGIQSKEAALEEILTLSHYQEDQFGGYHDTSADDTANRIIKGYYKYTSFAVKKEVSASDIIDELYLGHIIIIPANGQLLNNPHFTQPGPERHMLVIKGYDSNTSEFITNDPGIRQGEGYRYPKEVLYNAIRDYSTGYHIPITSVEKTMIVIKR